MRNGYGIGPDKTISPRSISTRRAADLADFDAPRRMLAARLATEDYGRLLLAGERTVEIAHEALITQWPWLQNTINEAATDMRVLDGLMDKAHRWNTTGSRGAEHLATGAERTEFSVLAQRRSDWLSTAEREFVVASDEAERASRHRDRRRQQFERRILQGAIAAALVFAATALFAGWQYFAAVDQRNQAQITRSLFLADLSRQQREADSGTAILLALEALPDTAAGVNRPYVPEAELQLDVAWRALRERLVLKGHTDPVWSAAFSPDGKRIVTASLDNTARLWDAESGKPIGERPAEPPAGEG